SDANDGISPDTALKTIHEAIYRVAADSLSQNTVHILPGEYSRTDNEQIFPIAMKSWVIVKGAGIDTTTVVGESLPDMAYNISCIVFFGNGEDAVFLSDLSITTRNVHSHSKALSATVKGLTTYFKNLRIYETGVNEAYQDIQYTIVDVSSTKKRLSTWENVTIENIEPANVQLLEVYPGILADGVVSAFKGIFKNCKFRNASSTYVSQSAWAMPLVSIRGDESLIFENCEFSNLSIMDDDSFAVAVGSVQYPQQHNHFSFQNCMFSNNSSQGGVVIVSSSNNPHIDITNCTFAGNTSDNYTLMLNGNVNITNSIFYNDSPYEIKVNPMDGNPNEYTHLTIDHSLLKGGIAGIIPYPRPGNTIDFLPSSFDADPLFQGFALPSNPLHYLLSELSPCIDSGTPDLSGLNLPPYDLAGNYRVWGSGIDLGCYEYGSEPWVSVYDPVLPVLEQLVLQQNYPNPFNPSTTIQYSLPKAARLRLDIFNVKGQLVKTLVNGEMPAGTHSIVWNGRDMKNKAVATGVYFYRISSPKEGSITKKMMLMK
ncbi:MAG: FlgD immunoglobulin-like domain containing protein, partial [Candidatus Cloacimonetes bacterium]|nr:FlgD immunoglobulin-like domain containing protein [Candidatus Cloacimonadota bacterium]